MKNLFSKTAAARLVEVEAEVAKLAKASEAAADALADAVEQRRQAVDEPDDALDKFDAAVERADTVHRRAVERLEAGRARLVAAIEAAGAEEAAARLKKAKTLRQATEPAIAPDYAKGARAVLETILKIAEADAQLETLEPASEGSKPASVERAARWPITAQEVEVSRRRSGLWCDRLGNPLSVQPRPDEVRLDGTGPYLVRDDRRFDLQQLDFEEVCYKPGSLARYSLAPLAEGVEFPGVKDGDPALWPPRNGPAQKPSELAEQIRSAISRLDAQLEALKHGRDDRPILTRLERVRDAEPPGDVDPMEPRPDLATIVARTSAATISPVVEPVRRRDARDNGAGR